MRDAIAVSSADADADADDDAGTPARAGGTLSFHGRVEVIHELVGALDRVTRSGQGHVMNRILNILRREIADAAPLPTPQLVVVTRSLADLAHEAGRISPIPASFNDHVRRLVEILSSVWRDRGRLA